MLLQSQELASLVNNNNNNNLNNIKNSEAINISKKFTEERSKSDSISMAEYNNETLEMKAKNIKRKISMKNRLSLKPKSSLQKLNINPIFLFENIKDSINALIVLFLEKHSNQDRVRQFRKENNDLNGACSLMKLIEEFEDFSFFDLISSSEYLALEDEKRKKFIIERNNFFLKVLFNIEENNYRVDDLVNQFVMRNTETISEIEVDYFFLCFLEYKDKSEALEIRHNEYFRSLLSTCSFDEGKRFYKLFNPRSYLARNSGSDNTTFSISEVEYNFVKLVIFSCIRRGFYEGILKLFDIEAYHQIYKEVEIWEKFILLFEAKKVYEIWRKYYEKFSKKNKSSLNHNQTPQLEKSEFLTLKNNPQREILIQQPEEPKLDDNFQLNDFTDLFCIIHNLLQKKEEEAYNKRIMNSPEVKHIKELAFYFLEMPGKHVKISQKIFEYCFDIDEDLGCAIINQVIDSNNVKEEYMSLAIEKKFFRLAFPLSKYKQCKELLYTSKMQDILLRYLRYGEYVYYAVCLFSSINDKKIITENSDKICKSFLILIRDEEGISRSRHSLITCVLGAEFLYRLGRLNVKYQYKCHSIAEMMVTMGQYLQEAIKEEDSLNYYLRTQTDDKGRSALEIIAENRFYALLQDENVAAIVSKLWYGQGKTVDLFGFSRIYSIVSSNIKHEHYNNIVSRETKEFLSKAFSFQFNQYIKNCSVRYLVDSVSTILTTILYQVIIYAYVLIMQSDDPDPNKNIIFNYSKICADIVVFSINLNLCFYMIYVYKSNRKLNLNIFILLDILLTVAVVFDLIHLPNSLFEDEETIQLATAIIYSFIIICAWLRVTNILITTRTFGPFLRIVYLILSTMVNFMIIFACFNTISAQVFTLLFYSTNPDFSAFFTSWVSLFMAAFSLYNFGNFTEALYLGYILLILYVTVSNLMLLNLIVSIISHQYEEYEALADSENRAVLVLTYERIKWDEKYGLLILLPAPFNLLNVVFIFTLFIVPETRKIYYNKLFSQISYIVIALANFSVLLVISFACYPTALAKSYLHSLYDGWSTFQFKTLHLVLFFSCRRPFELLYYILADVITFWKYCYVENEEVNEIEKKFFKMPKESIKFLRTIFEQKHRQRKKTVPVSEIYEKINQEKKMFGQNTMITMNFSGSVSNAYFSLNNSNSNNVGEIKIRNEMYLSVKSLCEKLMDKDEFIDIERGLVLLPKRIKYSSHFIEGIHSLNIKQTLKGLRKYFFMNSVNNPIYSYRKLQQMIYKILIKFKMIIQMVPEQYAETLVNVFEEENKKYERIMNEALMKKDEMMENEKDLNMISDEAHVSNEDTNINKNSKKNMNDDASEGSKAI